MSSTTGLAWDRATTRSSNVASSTSKEKPYIVLSAKILVLKGGHYIGSNATREPNAELILHEELRELMHRAPNSVC